MEFCPFGYQHFSEGIAKNIVRGESLILEWCVQDQFQLEDSDSNFHGNSN